MHKVILIDDDQNQLFLNTILLTEENIFQSVISFDDPTTALEYVRTEFDPLNDIIVLDINMPQMTAWEFLASLEDDFGQCPKFGLNLFIASHSSHPRDIKKANQHCLVKNFIDKYVLAEEVTKYAKAHIFNAKRLAC